MLPATGGSLGAKLSRGPCHMRQRIACTLIGSALVVICALVALLLSDALAPGR